MQVLIQTAVNTAFNVVLLAAIPFLVYFVFHAWRRKRGFMEITERAGLRLGKRRYIGYCAIFAAITVAVLVIFPPPTEPFTRDGSPQQKFVGLGLTVESITMAILYGVVATGFCEELLFRGLIAGSLSRRLSSRDRSWDRGWCTRPPTSRPASSRPFARSSDSNALTLRLPSTGKATMLRSIVLRALVPPDPS
jgi:hypothetical protein